MKNIFTYLVLLVFLASCSSEATETGSNSEAQTIETLKSELAAEQAEFDSLKALFDYEYDEFQKGGWHFHEHWGKGFLKRSTLSAVVGEVGTLYLASNYHGKSWIHHEAVQVKIGDQVLTSETIPQGDRLNQHEIAEGYAFERISYTRERDNGILKAIAATKDPVLVRLTGQKTQDFTLSKEDHQAIRDCVRLSELIRTLPDKEAQVKRLELGL